MSSARSSICGSRSVKKRSGITTAFIFTSGKPTNPIPLITTTYVCGVMVGVVIFGGLSDKFGRKAVILPSATVATVGALAFVLSGNYALLLFAMGLMMFGEGIAGPAPVAFAADIAQQKGLGGVGVGLFRTFGDLGFVLGPVAAGFVADNASYSWAFMVSEIMLLVTGVLLWFVAKEPRREPAPAAGGGIQRVSRVG